MTEEKDLIAFAESISGEVRERSMGDAEGAHFRETAFVEIVADHLEEIGMLDNPVICYHQALVGKAFIRLDGYAVPEDQERLDLLTAIFGDSGKPQSVSSEEVLKCASQAVRAISAAKNRIHEKMERASDAYGMMRRLSELLSAGLSEVRVLVLTDGLSTVKLIKPRTVDGVDVTFEVYDLRRLMRTMTSGQIREVIDIDLADIGLDPIPCIVMPSHGEGYEAYLAIFPGEALYRMYEEFGPRLLEYNVRAFLQATGRVNKGIRDTLQREPQYFMAYNNGISITVDGLSTEAGPGGGLVITRLKGMQIVNGGQTTASIHRARKRDRFDLTRVHVAAKITRPASETVEVMVQNISRYANTQNVIQEADFSSNERFHVALERLSKTIWCPGEQSRWFYERARGQYRTAMSIEGTTEARRRDFRNRTPATQKFTKTDLAKVLNSWNRLPHIVSSGAQKNFVFFMRSLREGRGSSWEPDEGFYRELIAKVVLFNTATRIIRKEGFPAYRANIICYLVAYLSHRAGGELDFDAVWRRQEVSAELEALLRKWSHPVAESIQESAGGRNVTEWCKKEGCWNAVKGCDLSLPRELPPELLESVSHDTSEAKVATLSSDERASIAECMKLSPAQWFSLHLWGGQNSNLAEWQIGIAHTLSRYASGGWQRMPSVKQARQAIRILETAREHGFWP
jgi:AIPR protein